MVKIELACRIKQLREMQGLTQKELGEVLNLSNTAVSQYEKGNKHPSIITLMTLAKYFNTSIDYLTGITDDSGSPVCRDDRLLLEYLNDDPELLTLAFLRKKKKKCEEL